MNEKEIHVFQELHLESSLDPMELRKALLRAVEAPWAHAKEQEKLLSRSMPIRGDVIVFSRKKTDGLEACLLSLVLDGRGFKVANIVPREARELGIDKYNRLLVDFAQRVVMRAAMQSPIHVVPSEPSLSLSDLVGKQAVRALEAFLSGANKATGSSHPSDRKRWFEFLVAVHREGMRPDGEAFERWLLEVENWPSDTAEQLVGELQFGLALLAYQDHSSL